MKTSTHTPSTMDSAPATFRQFLRGMLHAISAESDLDTALRLARWLALYLWENNLGIYRLDAIEEMVLEKCPPVTLDTGIEPISGAELHIASAVYKNGGHTALMRCLMRNATRTSHALITRCEDVDADAQILAIPPSSVSSPNNSDTAQQKISFLVNVMAKYERIVLHIHPDDVLCAVALGLLKLLKANTQIIFVNHADHVFSVGWPSVDRVLEISAYGWGLRHERDVDRIASFIGIPIPRPVPLTRQHVATPPFAMLGGASFKFKPAHGMSLPSILHRLLNEAPELHLNIVGASGKDWWWWPLRMRYRSRVHLRKSLPKDEYKKLLDACSIYIDSYPWLGGTAFPEALMLGVPVAGLTGLAWGYSSADELRAPIAQTFVQHCLLLLQNDPAIIRRQQIARDRCIEFHAENTVRKRMDKYLDEHILVEPDADLLNSNRKVNLRHQTVSSSVLPSRKRGGLTSSDIKTVADIHCKAFGLVNWSTLTLLYYARRASSGREAIQSLTKK